MSAILTILGRATRDPEMQQGKNSGTEYVSLDIAVSQRGQDGKEETIYYQCYFNKFLAERLAKAGVKKGTGLMIYGDLELPGISGEEVLAQIRKQGNTPVIVLTAKDGLDEKIGLLTSGADDYITKPFEIQEVLARIQVQLRHMQQEPEHKSVSYKNLELDRERFEVRIAGVLLPKITKQEFAILELLLEHPKQVFSKEEIFEYAWDEHYMGETKTLDVHISNIRKKIKAVTQEEYIDTVWGIGYRLHS